MGEIELPPGWLAADIKKAVARLKEWDAERRAAGTEEQPGTARNAKLQDFASAKFLGHGHQELAERPTIPDARQIQLPLDDYPEMPRNVA